MASPDLSKLLQRLGLKPTQPAAPSSDFVVPPFEWTYDGPLSPEADAFLTASNIEFNEKQKRFHEQYLKDQKRYDIDLGNGVLTITRRQGTIDLDVRALGSCRERDNTWEWAWNNPNAQPSTTFPRAALQPLAEKYRLRYLTAGAVDIPNDWFPWYLGGIALKVSPEAIGIYEARSGDMRYFFVVYGYG